jgi:hypothetical protein
VPGEALTGDSFGPLRKAKKLIGAADTGAAETRARIRTGRRRFMGVPSDERTMGVAAA